MKTEFENVMESMEIYIIVKLTKSKISYDYI